MPISHVKIQKINRETQIRIYVLLWKGERVKVVIKSKMDKVPSIKSSKDGKWISYSQKHFLVMFLLIIICRRDKFTKIDLDYEQLSTLNALYP